MTTLMIGQRPKKYIGEVYIVTGEVTCDLSTDRQKVLADIKRMIGNAQVTIKGWRWPRRG